MSQEEHIPAFTGGVAQQMPHLRLPTKLERQVNAITSLEDGLSKRHGTDYLGDLNLGHGGPLGTHFFLRDQETQICMVTGDREIKVFDLLTGADIPVYAKGALSGPTPGVGPQNFNYLYAPREEVYAITNSADLASVNTTTSAGKNGLATSKAVGGAGNTLGPWGGVVSVRTFTCDATAGHWFAWMQVGTGGSTLAAGWNSWSFMVKKGSNAATCGIALYDDTDADPNTGGNQPGFIVAVTFAWSGTSLGSTPTWITGSSTNPNIEVEREDVGFGWYWVKLRYRATHDIGHTYSIGPYMGGGAAAQDHIFLWLRYDRGPEKEARSYVHYPREAIQIETVNDTSLVLNRWITPAMDSDVSISRVFGTMLTYSAEPANNSSTTITISGTAKVFTYLDVPTADSDPNYSIDISGTPTASTVAQRMAEKINKAFGQGVAHSMGARVAITYAAGITPSASQSGSTNCTSATLDEMVLGFIRQSSYDDAFWLRFRQGANDARVATVVTSTLPAALGSATGIAKCVNGDDASSVANCSISYGGQGVRVPSTSRSDGITPDDVAQKIHLHLTTALGVTTDTSDNGYVVSGITSSTSIAAGKSTMVIREGGVFMILSGTAFDSWSKFDSVGGDSMIVLGATTAQPTDSVENETQLPTHALHDMRIRIAGSDNEQENDSFVRAVTESGKGFGKVKTWEQSTDYATLLAIDPATMPHQITIQRDDGAGTRTGTAYMRYALWDYANYVNREVGDGDEICPDPSFIGSPIQAVRRAESRVHFATKDRLISSEVNSNPTTGIGFFRTNVREVLADDPIDVVNEARAEVVTAKPATIHSVVPFGGKIYLFADSTVFVVDGDPLTSESISIRPVHEVSNIRYLEPRPTASSIFYGFQRGAYSGVFEMIMSEDGQFQRTEEVTKGVKRLIPGKIIQLAVSTEQDVLCVLSDGDQRTISIFKWDNFDGERAQSAWYQYTTGPSTAKVLGVGALQSNLFFVVQRPSGVQLERMALGNGMREADGTWRFCADRRLTETSPGVSVSYSPSTSTINIPWTIETGDTIIVANRGTTNVTQGATTVKPGDAFTVVANAASAQIFVVGVDLTAVDLWIGVQFSMDVQTTFPMLRKQSGAGKLTKNLRATRWLLGYYNTAAFSVSVGTKTKTHTDSFAAPFKGSAVVATTYPAFDDGVWEQPLLGVANEITITISSSSHLSCQFSTAEVIYDSGDVD